MTCIICDRSFEEAGILYRINMTGQKGVWACSSCLSQTDVQIDPDLMEISELIQEAANLPPSR
jgi:hypothetical protein